MPGGKTSAGSDKCRAARSRWRQAEAQAARDRRVRELLKAAVRVLGEGHDRRGYEEGAAMSPTIICPYCQLPQPVMKKPSDPPGEVYCPNCGGVLPWGPEVAARPTTVLWIDDDRLVLGTCAPVLERHGYRVLVATDGAAGIATARQERPDVILLDVMMPTMTGFDVCQELRADPTFQDTPIILLTALSDAEVGRTGKQLGATTTLRKPADPAAIVAFLDTVLHHRGGPPRP